MHSRVLIITCVLSGEVTFLDGNSNLGEKQFIVVSGVEPWSTDDHRFRSILCTGSLTIRPYLSKRNRVPLAIAVCDLYKTFVNVETVGSETGSIFSTIHSSSWQVL